MKAQWKKLTIWFIVLAIATVCIGGVAMAEDHSDPSGQGAGEIQFRIEDTPDYARTEPEPEPVFEPEPPSAPSANNSRDDSPVIEPEPVQTKRPVVYTICFVYFNGTSDKSFIKEVADNDVITEPFVTPMLEGHTFAFWYDDRTDSTPFVFGAAPSRDLTLVAFFVEEEAVLISEEAKGPDVPTSLKEGDDPNRTFIIEDDDAPFVIDSQRAAQNAYPENEEAEEGEPGDSGEPKITITCDTGEFAEFGTTVVLTAHPSGMVGLAYVIHWQYFDGSDWQTAPNSSGSTYQYELTEETCGMMWRVEYIILEQEPSLAQTDEI